MKEGEVICLWADQSEGRMGFKKKTKDLGVAYEDARLKETDLYFAVTIDNKDNSVEIVGGFE